ncbi:hypothetical protein YC2023_058039 [Brassica napus]
MGLQKINEGSTNWTSFNHLFSPGGGGKNLIQSVVKSQMQWAIYMLNLVVRMVNNHFKIS